MLAGTLIVAVAMAAAQPASPPEPAQTQGGLAAEHLLGSPELGEAIKSIFENDQADRANAGALGWGRVNANDQERRRLTKAMVDGGRLKSGDDYEAAAFVFSHGNKPDDYLLAHTLAMVAVAKGDAPATWIAAATLDRYLSNIGRPQVFGTQYNFNGKLVTQEPYNRTLVSDTLRRELGVHSSVDQRLLLKRFEAEAETRP